MHFVSGLFLCSVLLADGVAPLTAAPQSAVVGCDKVNFSAPVNVRSISIESPFDYSHSVRNEMLEALGTSELKKRGPFTQTALVNGQDKIRKKLNATALSLNLPVTINVVSGRVQQCDPTSTPPTVDVVYEVFVSWFPYQTLHSYETRRTESIDPARSAGVRPESFRLVPLAGYNRTARLFGGLSTTIPTSFGIFNVDGWASTSALAVSGSNSGKVTFSNGWLQRLEWGNGLLYSDVPTATNRLKQARLTSQFTADSVPIGPLGFSLRFGAALAGGHDQSTIPSTLLPSYSPVSSSVGELKMYAGLSLRSGRQSFKASYGLKLGEDQAGAKISFAKHIADTAYDVRFLPLAHRPIELETRLTAGWIQNLGAIPAPERFFGGNYDQSFLLGDSFDIRADPFIRSIPENRLDHIAPGLPIGGLNFISANATLALTTFTQPLVPAEMTSDPTFAGAVNAELATAKKILKAYWMSRDPAGRKVLESAPQAVTAIGDLSNQFNAVQNSVPENLSDRFGDCNLSVILAGSYADKLDPNSNSPGKKNTISDQFDAISSLILGADEEGSIDNLSACLKDLRPVLGLLFTDTNLPRLAALKDAIHTGLNAIDQQAAGNTATRDLTFVNQTVTTLLNEANFFAISPVLMMDLARIGPQSPGAGGIRYGLGGGLRFTLLDTIRFTGGYAFNPDPLPWEGRGAAFFSMEILSIFH